MSFYWFCQEHSGHLWPKWLSDWVTGHQRWWGGQHCHLWQKRWGHGLAGRGSLHFHSKGSLQTFHQFLPLRKHLHIELIKLNYSQGVTLNIRFSLCVNHKMNSGSRYSTYLNRLGAQSKLLFSVKTQVKTWALWAMEWGATESSYKHSYNDRFQPTTSRGRQNKMMNMTTIVMYFIGKQHHNPQDDSCRLDGWIIDWRALSKFGQNKHQTSL